MHYVVKLNDGSYQGVRKSTQSHYMSRTPSKGFPLDEARVFNTKGAATTSMRSAGLDGEVIPIQLVVNWWSGEQE